MAVGGDSRSVILDIRNAIKWLNIWFISLLQKLHVTVKPE